MSNTETISREELETILTQCRTYHADCIAPVSVRKVTTMARMLLEGMSNEPVAYVREDDLYDASIISTPAYRILEDLKEAAVPCEKLIGLCVSSPSPVSLLDSTEILSALKDALAWIDAVPSDMPLPAMPGFDRDEVNNLISRCHE